MTLYESLEQSIASPLLVKMWMNNNHPSPWRSARFRSKWQAFMFFVAFCPMFIGSIAATYHMTSFYHFLGALTFSVLVFLIAPRIRGCAERRFVADAKDLNRVCWSSGTLGKAELDAYATKELKSLAQIILLEPGNFDRLHGEDRVRAIAQNQKRCDELSRLYDLFLKFGLANYNGYGYVFDQVKQEMEEQKAETVITSGTDLAKV